MLSMAKSSYCYQEHAINAPDKYTELRTKVKNIFLENYSAYGYRRIANCQPYSIYVKEGMFTRQLSLRGFLRAVEK